MNSVVRQLWEQNTDIVMVDTGNSYEGLCEYVGGKYIAYTAVSYTHLYNYTLHFRSCGLSRGAGRCPVPLRTLP